MAFRTCMRRRPAPVSAAATAGRWGPFAPAHA